MTRFRVRLGETHQIIYVDAESLEEASEIVKGEMEYLTQYHIKPMGTKNTTQPKPGRQPY